LAPEVIGFGRIAIRPDVGHLVGNDEMMVRINCNLHVVANDPRVLATCRHRARVGIGERDLLVLALHHLRVDRVEPDDLLLELLDLALQPRNLRLRHRVAVPIGGLKLREISGDALVNPLEAPFHLGLSEVLVPRIDCLELRSVDGDARPKFGAYPELRTFQCVECGHVVTIEVEE
jgi:hypothetical protein